MGWGVRFVECFLKVICIVLVIPAPAVKIWTGLVLTSSGVSTYSVIDEERGKAALPV